MKTEQDNQAGLTASTVDYTDTEIETLSKSALAGPTPSKGVEANILAFAADRQEETAVHSHPFRWGAIAAAASIVLALGIWQITQNQTATGETHTPIAGVEAIVLFAQNGEEAQLADNAGISREEQIQALANRLLELEGMEAPEPFTLPELEESPEPRSTTTQYHRTRAQQV